MPAGVRLGRYIGTMIGAMLSMLAGAQAVHLMYNPLQNLFDKKGELHREKILILRKQLDKDEGKMTDTGTQTKS